MRGLLQIILPVLLFMIHTGDSIKCYRCMSFQGPPGVQNEYLGAPCPQFEPATEISNEPHDTDLGRVKKYKGLAKRRPHVLGRNRNIRQMDELLMECDGSFDPELVTRLLQSVKAIVGEEGVNIGGGDVGDTNVQDDNIVGNDEGGGGHEEEGHEKEHEEKGHEEGVNEEGVNEEGVNEEGVNEEGGNEGGGNEEVGNASEKDEQPDEDPNKNEEAPPESEKVEEPGRRAQEDSGEGADADIPEDSPEKVKLGCVYLTVNSSSKNVHLALRECIPLNVEFCQMVQMQSFEELLGECNMCNEDGCNKVSVLPSAPSNEEYDENENEEGEGHIPGEDGGLGPVGDIGGGIGGDIGGGGSEIGGDGAGGVEDDEEEEDEEEENASESHGQAYSKAVELGLEPIWLLFCPLLNLYKLFSE